MSDLRASLSMALGAAYLIERELTDVGTSRQFLANDLANGRDIIVKVLAPELAHMVDAEIFSIETRRLSMLEEPHTLPVYATGETEDGHVYIIRPLIRPDTLHQRLGEGPLGFDDAINVLRDIARSMAYAHSQNVLHLDLQPANVVLTRGTAIVTDFGIAPALRAAVRQPLHGFLLGSPAYMAPEQADPDATVDQRADIYAWGVLAYEVLADSHPFHDLTTADQFIAAHGQRTPSPMPYRRLGVPEQLALMVMRCLSKDAAERPENAAELLEVLDRIPVGSEALDIDGRTMVRLIVASIVIGVSLFIAGGVAVWRMQKQESLLPPLVAVLPFTSEGAVEDSTFTTGIGNAVTVRLSRLPGLRVMDRRSVLALSDEKLDARDAGRALGAEYVLSAVARWSPSVSGTPRIAISPRLMRVSDGTILWRDEEVTASLPDPFTAQTTLATGVATALGIVIGPHEEIALATRGTNDTAAFAAFTRGVFLQRESAPRTIETFRTVLREYERAYRTDSLYADAFGGASFALWNMARLGGPHSLVDSAAVLARRAVGLASNHATALMVLARIALGSGHPETAFPLIENAVKAAPSHVESRKVHAQLATIAGDSAAAWRDVELLLAIAPKSLEVLDLAADVAGSLRRFSDAQNFVERARELAPDRNDLLLRRATLAAASGDFVEIARSVHEYRDKGGQLRAPQIRLLRLGDSTMQRELAAAAPGAYDITTPADSFEFYRQKALFFSSLKNTHRSRLLFDSAGASLQNVLAHSTLAQADRQRFVELSGWVDAARNDHEGAVNALSAIDRAPFAQEWPDGQRAALSACNAAEIWGFFDAVVRMLPYLRRCLTLPGGFSTSALVTEPPLARHRNDPRVRDLLVQLRRTFDRN